MSFTRKHIISLPNKSLRQPSAKVGMITHDVQKLVDHMESATLDWEDHREHEVGVALAAVQINKKSKVVIIRNNFENKSDRTFQVLINPKITKLEGKLIEDFEGCLSIKDIYGKVPRYNKVKIKAQNIDGEDVRISAEGFLARVLQHEIDHTKGIVFVDHIKDNPDAFFRLAEDGKLKQLDFEKDIKTSEELWG